MTKAINLKWDWVPALTYISGAIVVIASAIAVAINVIALGWMLI